jgi:hypothetical protein
MDFDSLWFYDSGISLESMSLNLWFTYEWHFWIIEYLDLLLFLPFGLLLVVKIPSPAARTGGSTNLSSSVHGRKYYPWIVGPTTCRLRISVYEPELFPSCPNIRRSWYHCLIDSIHLESLGDLKHSSFWIKNKIYIFEAFNKTVSI